MAEATAAQVSGWVRRSVRAAAADDNGRAGGGPWSSGPRSEEEAGGGVRCSGPQPEPYVSARMPGL